MSRRARTAAPLLLVAVLAGCGVVPGLTGVGNDQPSNEKAIPLIVPVLAGQTAQGPFRAIAYRTSDGWTCLELVGGPGGSSCGQGDEALLGMGWGTSGPNGDGMVTGGTKLPGASAVTVLLDDGSVLRSDLAPVPAPIAPPGTAVFVIPYPPGRSPLKVVIVDATGAALETTDLATGP